MNYKTSKILNFILSFSLSIGMLFVPFSVFAQTHQAKYQQAYNYSSQLPQFCVNQLPNYKLPSYKNISIDRQILVLCDKAIVIGYFPGTRTGLWVSEYLTPKRVEATYHIKRHDSFHEDPRLKDGPKLSDYKYSGYDRGHLSPAGDQPDKFTQYQSFSLANMAPQAPHFNRTPWRKLESAVRDYAEHNPVYVVTGGRFIGQKIKYLKGRVAIPSTYYKLIYDPSHSQAIVYEGKNIDKGIPMPITVQQFQSKSGINFHLGNVTPLPIQYNPKD